MILPAGNAKVFVDQIFRIFDKDGNGSIDFKVYFEYYISNVNAIKTLIFQEFMMATDMTASGSPEEKLRWAFKMYDKDGSGQSIATITKRTKERVLSLCLSVLSIVVACNNK